MDSTDSFNRPSVLWSIGTRNIGNFVKDVYTDTKGQNMEYTTAVEVGDIYSSLSSLLSQGNDDKYQYGIYVDGVEYSQWAKSHGVAENLAATTDLAGFKAVINDSFTGNYAPSGYGALTQVFVIDDRTDSDGEPLDDQIIISTVNTHLAEVDYVEETNDGEGYITHLTYFQEAIAETGLKYHTIQTSVTTPEQFERGDYVMITATGDGLSAGTTDFAYSSSMKVVTINDVNEVPGVLTTVKENRWVELDHNEEEPYYYNVAMRGDVDRAGGINPEDLNQDLILYTDNYGYVLGYDIEEAAQNYFYVEGRDGDGWSNSRGVSVTVTDTNGDEHGIDVTQIDGKSISNWNYTSIPEMTRIMDANGDLGAANENLKVDLNNYFVDESELENRIFGYDKLEDGTYNLKTGIQTNGLLELGSNGALGVQTDAGRDTMAIFTSVRYADGVQNDEKNYAVDDRTKVNGELFSVDDTILMTGKYWDDALDNYGNLQDKNGDPLYSSADRNAYAIVKGAAGVMAMTVTPGETKTFTNTYSSDATENNRGSVNTAEQTFNITNNDNKNDLTYADYAFRVDSNTVFVDVVNGYTAVGHSTVSSMDSGDLNMQVLFGSNGCADVVFINNGAPVESTSKKYFIMDDANYRKTTKDGVEVWEYNVYINGAADKIYATEAVVESLGGDLETNVLYRVEEYSTSGIVTEVTELLDYENITDISVGPDGTVQSGNDSWSVARSVEAENMYLKWDVAYEHSNTKKGTSDNFAYDDDTTFVVVNYDNNGNITSVRAGDEENIIPYSTNGANGNTSWIDVVSVRDDGKWNAPIADLVMILQPNTTEGSTDGGLSTANYGGVAMFEKLGMEFFTSETDSTGTGGKNDPLEVQGYLDVAGYTELPWGENSSEYLAKAAVEDYIKTGLKLAVNSFVEVKAGTSYGTMASTNWELTVNVKDGNSNFDMYFEIELSDSTENAAANNWANSTIVDAGESNFTVGIPETATIWGLSRSNATEFAEYLKVIGSDGAHSDLDSARTAGSNSSHVEANKTNWTYGTKVSEIATSVYDGTANGALFGNLSVNTADFFTVKIGNETQVYSRANFKNLTLGDLRGAEIACSVSVIKIEDAELEKLTTGKMSFGGVTSNNKYSLLEIDGDDTAAASTTGALTAKTNYYFLAVEEGFAGNPFSVKVNTLNGFASRFGSNYSATTFVFGNAAGSSSDNTGSGAGKVSCSVDTVTLNAGTASGTVQNKFEGTYLTGLYDGSATGADVSFTLNCIPYVAVANSSSFSYNNNATPIFIGSDASHDYDVEYISEFVEAETGVSGAALLYIRVTGGSENSADFANYDPENFDDVDFTDVTKIELAYKLDGFKDELLTDTIFANLSDAVATPAYALKTGSGLAEDTSEYFVYVNETNELKFTVEYSFAGKTTTNGATNADGLYSLIFNPIHDISAIIGYDEGIAEVGTDFSGEFAAELIGKSVLNLTYTNGNSEGDAEGIFTVSYTLKNLGGLLDDSNKAAIKISDVLTVTPPPA